MMSTELTEHFSQVKVHIILEKLKGKEHGEE